MGACSYNRIREESEFCCDGMTTSRFNKSDGNTLAVRGKVLQVLSEVTDLDPEEAVRPSMYARLYEEETYRAGHVLFKQGDQANGDVYVIASGRATVLVNGEIVSTLSTGAHISNKEAFRNEWGGSATVIAETQLVVLKIIGGDAEQMKHPSKFKRKVVGGTEFDLSTVVQEPTPKSAQERQMIVSALKANPNLTAMVELDDEKCKAMADIAWEQVVQPDTALIQQGSNQSDYFYVVKQGSFEITVETVHSETGERTTSKECRGIISAGGSFGELALIYFAPRSASVKAKELSVVYVIDRAHFKNILAKSEEELAKKNVACLDSCDVFTSLLPEEKLEVSKALLEADFLCDEVIFHQGEEAATFYILIDGELAVIEDNQQVKTMKGTQDEPRIFGELALLRGDVRSATIKVLSSVAKTLCMDKASFELLLHGTLEDIKRDRADSAQARSRAVTLLDDAGLMASVASMSVASLKDDDAAMVQLTTTGKTNLVPLENNIPRRHLADRGLLGVGGFGSVRLVEHKDGQLYALKIVGKGHVVESRMQKSIIREKCTQLMCDSAFIVRLFVTYTDDQNLYFLLEVVLGGDLHETMHRHRLHGSVQHVRFYVAGAVYALEYMHGISMIYRDLKPENSLLSDAGRFKLGDMGLAKIVIGKTYTTCGTVQYLSPEMIDSVGHSKAVDWWTLGVFIFELMTSDTPFEVGAKGAVQICTNIKKGITKVAFPEKMKGSCEKLVKALLQPRPSSRLPMRSGGIKNIMKHAWYSSFDWAAMKNMTLDPPFVPKYKSKEDLFATCRKREKRVTEEDDFPPAVPYKDDGSGWDADFATST